MFSCACPVDTNSLFDVVDIFDGNTGTWNTAKLSVARGYPSATSLPSHGLALFAGGMGSEFLWKSM